MNTDRMPAVAWTERARTDTIASYEVWDTPPENEFDDIARMAAEVCGTDFALVNVVDESRQFFKAEHGVGYREAPIEVAFCSHAVLSDDIMVVQDALQDPRFRENPVVLDGPRVRFYAGVPMRTADGVPIGTVCVLGREPMTLGPHQERTLRLLARQAMTQFELRRTLGERERALEEVRLAQRRQADTMVELAHRMKNVIAMVQAITTQSLRSATSLEEAERNVVGRISALASAQDLLMRPDLAPSSVLEIVRAGLRSHMPDEGRLDIDGPTLVLPRERGIGLALALHELATNATKHGSLSVPEGRVGVRWSAEGGSFRFEWKETAGPVVTPPLRAGFGTRLLERVVPGYFGGKARCEPEASGIRYVLEGPMSDDPAA